MVLQKTDIEEVRSITIKMKNKKSTVHDGNRNELLKLCSSIIEQYLMDAINKTSETQRFRICLKVAKIIELFQKKTSTSVPENYCPIGLLSARR